MGGAGKNTRPLACQPPLATAKNADSPPAPRAIADCPIGTPGLNRGTRIAVNRAGVDRGSEIGGAAQGEIGETGP